jgi:hypothetical protein
LLATSGSCEVSTILSAEGISACEQAAQVSAYISERSQTFNPSFCKGWVYFMQCGHIRGQCDFYRQSWVRRHVNPSEHTALNCDVLHSDLKKLCVCTTDSVSFTYTVNFYDVIGSYIEKVMLDLYRLTHAIPARIAMVAECVYDLMNVPS